MHILRVLLFVVAGAVNADSLYVVDVVAGAVYTQMLRVLLSIIK